MYYYRMSPIRVALVTSVIDNRKAKGTALVARELLSRILDAPDISYTLIHHESSDDGIYTHHPTIQIPHLPFPFNQMWVRELVFWLTYKGKPFDVVHYMQPRVWPSYLATKASHVVISAHDAGVMLNLHTPSLADWVFRITNRFLHMRMTRIIAVSEYARQEIIRLFHIDPSRVVSIPNALSSSFTKMKDSYPSYGLPETYILCIGRFDPHKNIVRLLHAYRQARDAGLVEPLILVGGKHLPSYSKQVEKTIQELQLEPYVHVAPYIEDEDLYGVYKNARAVIYPSTHEGFGLPLLEAMYAKVPVAASNVTSLPEVAGNAALFFDPYDIHAMCSALVRITTDEMVRAQLIKNGEKRVMSFSWEEAAQKLLGIYRDLTAS